MSDAAIHYAGLNRMWERKHGELFEATKKLAGLRGHPIAKVYEKARDEQEEVEAEVSALAWALDELRSRKGEVGETFASVLRELCPEVSL